MGAPNYSQYTLTKHSIERYRERIERTAKEYEILKDVRNLLKDAEYVDTAVHNGSQKWLHRERGIIMVLDTYKKALVTIHPESCDSIVVPNAIHPSVIKRISEVAKEIQKQELKRYYGILGGMYEEYGQRMGNLSRVKNPDYYTRGTEELEELRGDIKVIEDELAEVMRGYDEYIDE